MSESPRTIDELIKAADHARLPFPIDLLAEWQQGVPAGRGRWFEIKSPFYQNEYWDCAGYRCGLYESDNERISAPNAFISEPYPNLAEAVASALMGWKRQSKGGDE